MQISEEHKDIHDEVNVELAQIAGGECNRSQEDALAALRQLPAPTYALDTLQAVLSTMARSVVTVENDTQEVLDLVSYDHKDNAQKCWS